jgi:hypothetical protein
MSSGRVGEAAGSLREVLAAIHFALTAKSIMVGWLKGHAAYKTGSPVFGWRCSILQETLVLEALWQRERAEGGLKEVFGGRLLEVDVTSDYITYVNYISKKAFVFT